MVVLRKNTKERDCPMIASRGREINQVAPSISKDDAPTKRRFYALRTGGERPRDGDYDEGKSLPFFLVILVPSKWGSMISRCNRIVIEICCMCMMCRSFVEIELH